VPINLRVGAVAEAVTISGAVTEVQVSSPTTGQTIQNVGDLPLSTRNFLSLLALSTVPTANWRTQPPSDAAR
jgi:hypothetical protein